MAGIKFKKIERKLGIHPFRPTPGLLATTLILLLVTVPLVRKVGEVRPTTKADTITANTSDSNIHSNTALATIQQPTGFGIAVGGTLQNLSDQALDSQLTDIAQLGFTWIRFDMQWETVQPSNTNKYDWAPYDRIVNVALQHGLHVLPTLAYAPQWARLSACSAIDKCAPGVPAQFAAFAKAAAYHFSLQGVSDWEIWNEPNLRGFWQPQPNAADYVALLRATYPAIKSAEPNATVITGGLGSLDQFPKSIDALSFLNEMYTNGAKSYFDAVGYHPYSYPALPDAVASWSGWSKMNALPLSMRSIMQANGDSSKSLWLTEFGAPTDGPGAKATIRGYNPVAAAYYVDDTLQAEMATQVVAYVRSSSWIGPMFWYSYKDLGTAINTNENFFGLVTANGAKKPVYYTFKQLLAPLKNQ